MGASQCCSGTGELDQTRYFEYEFGEDKHEPPVNHLDNIESSDEACRIFLYDCQQKLKQSSRLYKDPSLSSQPLVLREPKQGNQIRCVFVRPYNFLKIGRGGRYKVFDETIRNCDCISIRHDALQYFSMFLCFLADKPHLIRSIILTQSNTYGIHAISMYVHGERKHVFIDDYILCDQIKPIFSQPVEGEYMWPCLIEKAWLKVGGYSSNQIQVTSPISVFQHFFQYPCANYNLSKMDGHTFDKLKKSIFFGQQNNIMVTSKLQPPHKIGLSGKKSFYFKCLFEFQGKNLYYLRNPCGSFDFRGLYKTVQEQIMLKMQKIFGFQMKEGNFLLQEQQFLEQMQEIQVFYYNKNSAIISEFQIKSNIGEQAYLSFDLAKDQQISFYFVQENEPFFPVTYQLINPNEGIIISGLNNEDGCFGVHSTNLLTNIFQNLPKGNYLLRLKKKPVKNFQIPLVSKDKLIMTASTKVNLTNHYQDLHYGHFIEFLKRYAAQNIQRMQSYHRGKQIQHGSFWLGDLVVVYVSKVERGSLKRVNLEVNFPDRVNLECISHSLNSQFTALPLNQDQLLIIFQKIDLTGETILGKYSIENF